MLNEIPVGGNALLKHIWNRSPAVDRVWSLVAGMGPSRAVRRPFIVFRAFVDESYENGSWFVLAGFIASAETWAAFAADWEEVLPRFGLYDEVRQQHYFHMNEMAESPERMSRVPVFARIINRHLPLMISFQFYMPDVAKAQARLEVPGRRLEHFPPMSEIYRLGWNQMLAGFAGNRQVIDDVVPVRESVQFIFDRHSDARKFLTAWATTENYPTLSGLFDKEPGFEDDREFEGLQAADLFAWHVRHALKSGANTANLHPMRHLLDQADPKPFLSLTLNEDGITSMLMEGTADKTPNNLVVIDRKTGASIRGRAQ